MKWKPTDDVDREVREWMRSKGWEVNRTNYNFDREIFAWRHQLPGRQITYPPGLPLRSRAVPRLRGAVPPRPVKGRPGHPSSPEARLVVVQNGTKVSLMELSGTDEEPS
jgi:hypothetical protein